MIVADQHCLRATSPGSNWNPAAISGELKRKKAESFDPTFL
jgi:hypothetical protein